MKDTFPRLLFVAISLLMFAAVPAYAAGNAPPRGITLDGTTGTSGKLSLPGPDYQIRAEYGQQAGANLFHSFQQFNIHSDESATFKGPNSVRNIITRVTGGDASWIDGLLSSEIPGADLYLLNPAGVMFGANAALDLNASFHVSTADYLRMGTDGQFPALAEKDAVLSAEAPTAFGFLDGDIGPITFEGRGRLTERDWKGACEGGRDCQDWWDWNKNNSLGLWASEANMISVIGGDIRVVPK